jgi:hypothetical protein
MIRASRSARCFLAACRNLRALRESTAATAAAPCSPLGSETISAGATENSPPLFLPILWQVFVQQAVLGYHIPKTHRPAFRMQDAKSYAD